MTRNRSCTSLLNGLRQLTNSSSELCEALCFCGRKMLHQVHIGRSCEAQHPALWAPCSRSLRMTRRSGLGRECRYERCRLMSTLPAGIRKAASQFPAPNKPGGSAPSNRSLVLKLPLLKSRRSVDGVDSLKRGVSAWHPRALLWASLRMMRGLRSQIVLRFPVSHKLI